MGAGAPVSCFCVVYNCIEFPYLKRPRMAYNSCYL